MNYRRSSARRILFVIFLIIAIFFLGYISRPVFIKNEPFTGIDQRVITLSDEKVISNKLVAVDAQGNGVTANLLTRVRQGNGLVLVNINNVLADISTQQSARTAVKAAAAFAHVDPKIIDVIFTVDTNAGLISGGSAGSSLAIAVVAALTNQTIPPSIVMTGDISEDGAIGIVQAIPKKAEAAKSVNATLFLVPVGGSSDVVKFSRQKECGKTQGYDYCRIVYVAEKGQLGEEVGLRIVEVKDLAEAAQHYFGAKEGL